MNELENLARDLGAVLLARGEWLTAAEQSPVPAAGWRSR